jgi:hypothetical protein
MTVLVAALAFVLGLLAVLVAGLLRSHAEILRALHDLGADLDPAHDIAQAPTRVGLTVPRPRAEPKVAVDLAGMTPHGDAVSIAIAGASHPTLLAFLTSGCSTCVDFWNAFADVDRLRVPGNARLVVVTKGEDGESPGRLRKFVPPDVPVVMSSAAWEAYDVPVAPYFAYIDGPTARVVGEGAAATWDHLAGMMAQAVEEAGISSRARRGRPRRLGGAAREARVDRTLAAAGIEPGHPSLYPVTDADLHDRSD